MKINNVYVGNNLEVLKSFPDNSIDSVVTDPPYGLGKEPNGICLDPYLGSGTTAIACEMEKFSWIGIELMPEYAEIAKARIGAVKDYDATLDTKTIIKESIKEDKEEKLGIQNIFDFMED